MAGTRALCSVEEAGKVDQTLSELVHGSELQSYLPTICSPPNNQDRLPKMEISCYCPPSLKSSVAPHFSLGRDPNPYHILQKALYILAFTYLSIFNHLYILATSSSSILYALPSFWAFAQAVSSIPITLLPPFT